jgi:hypothetical protein
MTWLDLVTVQTPTDSRSQRSKRSSLTSNRVAAGMQPKSACGGGGTSPPRALPASVTATEV